MSKAILLWIPVSVVFLLLAMLAALPIPMRLALLAGLLLLGAVAFGLLAVYDARRPSPTRPAMHVSWSLMGLGLGAYSIALGHMSQSWLVPAARLPALVGVSLVVGSTLIAASVFLFLRAAGRSRSAAS